MDRPLNIRDAGLRSRRRSQWWEEDVHDDTEFGLLFFECIEASAASFRCTSRKIMAGLLGAATQGIGTKLILRIFDLFDPASTHQRPCKLCEQSWEV